MIPAASDGGMQQWPLEQCLSVHYRLAAAVTILIAAVAAGCAAANSEKGAKAMGIAPLASDYVIVYRSPAPQNVYCYSPGIARCPNGRLIATMDLGGPGVSKLPGVKGWMGKSAVQGKIFTSDDRGKTWAHRFDFPFMHARPFIAGRSVYVLGHCGDLMIIRSDDWGETWSSPVSLTRGEHWHQAPCNVWYANGKVYLVMEKLTPPHPSGWPVTALAPIVMAAPVSADLTVPSSWTFSNALAFRDVVQRYGSPNLLGVPFFNVGPTAPDNPTDRRIMNPIGWLETNIVQFSDPDHIWYDPSGCTFYLFMRAHTGTTNLACIAKAVEAEDGRIVVDVVHAPSGKVMLYVPLPGGQMKFHIVYDEKTKLFWLLSSQSTDSMTRPDRLSPRRFNLPNNERHRLALHFSRNCIDWCFAGIVDMSDDPLQSRHYASMVIDEADLHVLSRSGDAHAKNPHDTDMITFHTVHDFRELVY